MEHYELFQETSLTNQLQQKLNIFLWWVILFSINYAYKLPYIYTYYKFNETLENILKYIFNQV